MKVLNYALLFCYYQLETINPQLVYLFTLQLKKRMRIR